METAPEYTFDLIVAGGGTAGAAAALSAAREGLSVLLVEAAGALGGAAVNCLVNPFMSAVAKIGGEQVHLCRGLYFEIAKALDDDNVFFPPHASTWFSEETLKVVLDRKMSESGVRVLLHATLCGARTEGRVLKSVSVATVGGVREFRARAFIDATGDAMLAHYAGCPCQVGRGEDALCQSLTLNFRICNVDTDAFWRTRDEINALFRKFRADGRLSCNRRGLLVFRTVIPGVLHFNQTSVIGIDPTDPFALSAAEAEARGQVVELFHFLKGNVACFRNASLAGTASAIGVRESRRIEARHMLTEEEVLAGVRFEDGIAACNYPIDIHSPTDSSCRQTMLPEGTYYTIPYRSLLPRPLDNLVVAGRCVGATHEAQASLRIMPACIAMGEAAGTAVALALGAGRHPADVDVAALRKRLVEKGAFVGQP